MTKTIIIGDLHLQAGLILPSILKTAKQKKVNNIVLLGDYFDQWHQNDNDDLYAKEIKTIQKFKEACSLNNISIEFLIGNHDLAYILPDINEPFMSESRDTRFKVYESLVELQPKLFTICGKYLLSHAGFTHESEPIIINDINSQTDQRILNQIYNDDDSCVWFRHGFYDKIHNSKHPYQIIGHTTVKSITPLTPSQKVINIDTFSLNKNLSPIGDGTYLIIDDTCDHVDVIKFNNWNTTEMDIVRKSYFKKAKETYYEDFFR